MQIYLNSRASGSRAAGEAWCRCKRIGIPYNGFPFIRNICIDIVSNVELATSPIINSHKLFKSIIIYQQELVIRDYFPMEEASIDPTRIC